MRATELAGDGTRDHEDGAAGKHLYAGPQQPRARHRCAARIDGPGRPAHRRDHRQSDPDGIDGGQPADGCDEHHHAREAGDDARDHQQRWATTGQERLEQVHPDRDCGDQDRGDPGVDVLL